jgi:methylated-DNA-protein-cysteine methyltransferase-like protein
MDPIEIPGSIREDFWQAVWQIVRQIPAGKVATYGQIAARIPLPDGSLPDHFLAYRARWVGQAMAACPKDVPWQRVVNSQGKISARHGADEQRRLLEQEGVSFDARDRIDLRRFGWQPGIAGEDDPIPSQPSLF